MACFTVPVAEAIVTTVAARVIKKREQKAQLRPEGAHTAEAPRISLSEKLGWLNMMLWGGSLLLLLEHIWHGEVVPWFPFLTAAASPEDTREMLHEMATVGVGMAIVVTAVWAVMAIAADIITRRPAEAEREDAV